MSEVHKDKKKICCRVNIKGIVQGVGFRPFVYNLARKYGLKGWVLNSSRGVTLEIEGTPRSIEDCLRELSSRPPRLAKINEIVKKEYPAKGYTDFKIRKSICEGQKDTLISPDMAVCRDCLDEIFNPSDRHFHYPFTNCTNCGPRFTIIRDVPYDRKQTSMDKFFMCAECRREYNDPGNRRFHAQPNACPACGPRVSLVDREGKEISRQWASSYRRLILEDKIIAVKGLGGFHLTCDAGSIKAVEKLRRKKNRPYKPLAVMCRDIEVVKKHCRISPQEEIWLSSPQAPILILEKRGDSCLPALLAPNISTLGVMLPYTPLHMLLFGDKLETLVMTSGNISDLPLVIDNYLALEYLGDIADCFLLHDREIINRCDDSLGRVVDNNFHVYRRSRGFTPSPINVPLGSVETLGAGGEMKNTFCLLKNNRAFLSQHLGEMSVQEGLDNFCETLANFQRLTGIQPRVIAYDLHPEYRISFLARELPAEIHVPVQHHHAHMAACMAENKLDGEVIGVVCDGTGYGKDGCIWGFEILKGNYCNFERKFHLAYLPIPGGESSIRRPWRMGISYLNQYLGKEGVEMAFDLFPRMEQEILLTVKMQEKEFNSPFTSSCGRLFDAVSSLLGICQESTYEGQAAAELNSVIEPSVDGRYPFLIKNDEIDPGPMIVEIVKDIRNHKDVKETATKFHNSVVSMIVNAVSLAGEQENLHRVVLSGGVFQNNYLLCRTLKGLREKGFQVFYHREVPTGDGGLSLGQAVIGANLYRKKKKCLN